VHRYAPAPDLWTDSMLLRGQELIGIWRSNVSDINSECSARGPLFAGDGQAALSAIRAEHETEPHVFTSPLDAMSEAPARIEVFAPPGPLPIPTGRVTRSNRLMVMWEHYGRFTVRDLQTGKTYRPEPPVSGEMHDPFPIGDKVVYWVFGPKRSVWVWSVDGESQPLLLDDAYSYDRFVTDGTDAVWIRGQNPIGANSYEVAELWTAPLALEPGALEPRKLVTLPGNGTRNTSVGDGWGATGMSYFGMPPFQDIRLYRLSDGAEKRLPVVEGYGWDSGQYAGLVIDGGAVWVRSLRDPGNDVRFITRFDIDALPDGPASP
jgi:hypothetical protein